MVRSWLYVPADRSELYDKALRSGAGGLIVDLEDAVAPTAKDAARHACSALLAQQRDHAGDQRIAVRINSNAVAQDIDAAQGADSLVIPKATSATIDAVVEHLGSDSSVRLCALIESAQGVLDAAEVARHHLVERLALGEADLCAELKITPSGGEPELAAIRTAIVVASAAAGIESPTAGVSTQFRDLELFTQSCVQLHRMGFGSRSAIHPAQIGVIESVFAPTPQQLAAARAILEQFEAATASGVGVIVGDDGTMIDEAVVRSARSMLGSA